VRGGGRGRRFGRGMGRGLPQRLISEEGRRSQTKLDIS
jgi:hypothetical protein